jgi:hypothetical protein
MCQWMQAFYVVKLLYMGEDTRNILYKDTKHFSTLTFSSSHPGEESYRGLPAYDPVQSGRWILNFPRNILHLPSDSCPENGGIMFLINIGTHLPDCNMV